MKFKDILMDYIDEFSVVKIKETLPICVYLYEDCKGNILDFKKLPTRNNVPKDVYMLFSLPLYAPRFHSNGLLMGGFIISVDGDVKYLNLEAINIQVESYSCN
jgi:hypothetical protein